MAAGELYRVVALALGVAEVVAMTAGASIIPAAVRPERLEPANARITAIEYLFNGFAGAPIGGFLVAAGFGIAFGVTGVVYVLGAVFLFLLSGDFAAQPVKERAPMHVEIRDGLAFLWQNRLLRACLPIPESRYTTGNFRRGARYAPGA